MKFDHVDPDTSMHHLAVEVADEFREAVKTTWEAMYLRNKQMGGGMANVTLAGLTVVWLECVHATMGTPDSESAISLLRHLRPDDKSVARDMRGAARDFLRRSYWLPKRRAQ